MNRIEFVEELKKLNIDLSPKQEDQFYTYAALLKEWNEKMNSKMSMIRPHIWN